jgi:hypothetical protein
LPEPRNPGFWLCGDYAEWFSGAATEDPAGSWVACSGLRFMNNPSYRFTSGRQGRPIAAGFPLDGGYLTSPGIRLALRENQPANQEKDPLPRQIQARESLPRPNLK